MKFDQTDPLSQLEGMDDVLLGLGAMPDPEEEGLPGDPDDVQDLEGLGFFLWMNEEVDKEQARRQAKAPSSSSEKP